MMKNKNDVKDLVRTGSIAWVFFSGSWGLAQDSNEGLPLISGLNSTSTSLVDLDSTTVETWYGAAFAIWTCSLIGKMQTIEFGFQ